MKIFEASHKLAYELLPTDSQEIQSLDKELNELYS
jgi:hypothetical protein